MTSFKGCHPYSSVPSFSRHDHRLVRKSTIHHSKLSGKISRLATAAGEATAHPIRTRMPRMDTNKSVREIDGHKFPGYRLHLTPVRHQRSPSNVPDQPPRATDVWIATQTRSRGSLHPVGSATSCSHNLKISGRPRRTRSDGRPCHCAGNVTATDAKHTKRNPRHRRETPRPPNSTGGNGGNRGPIPSPFPPLPPVQNARAAQFRRTVL